MKLTLEQLKRMIKIELREVDLGKQVWSRKAHPGHLKGHSGDEPDTKIESDIFDQLQKFLGGPHKNIITDEVVEAIGAAMRDKSYSDIFIAGKGSVVMQGKIVPRATLQKHVERKLATKPGIHDYNVNFTFNPLEWGETNKVSAWTTNAELAEDIFRKGGRYLQPHKEERADDIVIMLFGEIEPGLFLDLQQIYHYTGMDKFNGDDQFLALGPVEINKVVIMNPEEPK